jgi:hypothetical protein
MKKEELMERARKMNIRGRSRMTKDELKKNIIQVRRKMRGGELKEEDVQMLIYRDFSKNPMIYREYEDGDKLYNDYRIYKIKKVEIPITYKHEDSVFWKRDDMDILHIYFYRYDNFNSRIRGKHLSNSSDKLDVNRKLFISPNGKILVRLNQVKSHQPLPDDMFNDADIPPIKRMKNGKKPYYNLPLNSTNEEIEEEGIEMVEV